MPPHRLSRPSPYVSSLTLLRGAKSLVLVATLVLAGCATNPSKQLAEGNSSHNIARDKYLSLTQSDPLGAYLSNQDQAYSTAPHRSDERRVGKALVRTCRSRCSPY